MHTYDARQVATPGGRCDHSGKGNCKHGGRGAYERLSTPNGILHFCISRPHVRNFAKITRIMLRTRVRLRQCLVRENISTLNFLVTADIQNMAQLSPQAIIANV